MIENIPSSNLVNSSICGKWYSVASVGTSMYEAYWKSSVFHSTIYILEIYFKFDHYSTDVVHVYCSLSDPSFIIDVLVKSYIILNKNPKYRK